MLLRERGKSRTAGGPKENSTDTGAEFKEKFKDLLEKEEIGNRFKESVNSLAVVDAAIRTLKITFATKVTDTGSES